MLNLFTACTMIILGIIGIITNITNIYGKGNVIFCSVMIIIALSMLINAYLYEKKLANRQVIYLNLIKGKISTPLEDIVQKSGIPYKEVHKDLSLLVAKRFLLYDNCIMGNFYFDKNLKLLIRINKEIPSSILNSSIVTNNEIKRTVNLSKVTSKEINVRSLKCPNCGATLNIGINKVVICNYCDSNLTF